jgi:hypothetical protein
VGDQYFNTVNNELRIYNGSTWQSAAIVGGTVANLTVNNDSFHNGVRVGRGLGSVATNTAVGASALAANTTGTHNNAFGMSALASNTTGGANVAMGWLALYANTTGSEHVALGHAALGSNTTGIRNVAIGHTALNQNTTASNGAAIGYQAAYLVTTALGTTAVGSKAGFALTTGNYNTFVGAFAGEGAGGAITGAGNTAIGPSAGASLTTGSYNSFFGPAGQVNQGPGGLITTGSKNTILGGYNGNQAGLDIRTSSGNVVISDGDGNRIITGSNGGTLGLGNGAYSVNGTGITFPATQNASSDANTLDDYEEGTWTPVLSGTSTPPGLSYSAAGKYVKVGNQVTANFFIYVDTVSSQGSGNMTVSLPFTVASSNNADENCGNTAQLAISTAINGTGGIRTQPGHAYCFPLYKTDDGNVLILKANTYRFGYFIGQITYFT